MKKRGDTTAMAGNAPVAVDLQVDYIDGVSPAVTAMIAKGARSMGCREAAD